MSLPSDIELDIIYHQAFHDSKRSSDSTWSLDAIAAVKRAIIEGLAEEAEKTQYPDPYLPIWIRSHVPTIDPRNLDGYTYLGQNAEDDLPVYQKDADSSLWIRAGEAWVPFSITHDHTDGLGRMKP